MSVGKMSVGEVSVGEVYNQNTRGQRCSYWKTAPYAPARLIYGSCPRFAPKTVDAPINPVHQYRSEITVVTFYEPGEIEFKVAKRNGAWDVRAA